MRRVPLQQRIEYGTECLTPDCQEVFHLWRYLWMHDPLDNPVTFHLAKLLGQHFLGDAGNCPLKIRKTQHVPSKEVEHDRQLPPAIKDPEGSFNTLGRLHGSHGGMVTFLFVTYFFVGS